MGKLFVLIDPNDENLDGLTAEVNSLKPENVWVGCSVASGKDIASVFENLGVPADLFPGNFDQMRKGYASARRVYVPDPLFYSNLGIGAAFEICSSYAGTEFPDKCEYMNYVLLNPDCTAAKVLGVNTAFDDETVIGTLRGRKVHHYVYLEGGSRNVAHPITERSCLIRELKRQYPGSHVICGGGISGLHQASSLKDSGVSVLVSNAVHKNPRLLEQFMKLFE